MRRFGFVLIGVAMASSAHAGSLFDLPVLRGAFSDEPMPNYQTRWEGFYAGGQASYTESNIGLAQSTQDLVTSMLASMPTLSATISQWPTLSNVVSKNASYGAFVGYNWQWDAAVLGLEVNYSHQSATGTSLSVVTPPPVTYVDPGTGNPYMGSLTLAGQATMKIKEFATFRARAGWSWNNFLPYAFGGVAVGLADYSRSATLNGTLAYSGTNVPAPPDITINAAASEVKNNRLVFGYSAGLGTEVLLAGNVFGRVEWEFTQLTGTIPVALNSVRAGLGMKF